MMKNAYYFLLKVLFVLGVFCSIQKRLDKKTIVNFKIYDFMTRQQLITIPILLNISRNKGNQTMKFGQVIE